MRLKQLFIFSIFYPLLFATPSTYAAFKNSCLITLNTQYTIDSKWDTGYQVSVFLKNPSQMPTVSWTATFKLPTGHKISSLWNGSYTVSGNAVTVKNPSWWGGGQINPGATVSIGMVVVMNTGGTPGIFELNAQANADPAQCSEPVIVPNAPQLQPIVVDAQQPRNYTVSWKSVENAVSYSLEQATSSDFANAVIVTQGAMLSFTVQNQPNGTYYYRVAASNSAGKSPYSNVESIIINQPAPSLSAPVLNQVANNGSNRYTLTWSAVSQAQSYQVEESLTNDFAQFQILFTGAVTSYEIVNKANGSYYYRVKALAGTTTSQPSNTINVQVNQQPTNSQKKIVGYYPNWAIYRSPSFKPENINGALITHINYAFLKTDAAGNVTLTDTWADTDYRSDWNTEKPFWGNFRQLVDLKQKYPHLKTLISIGGWTLSDTFPAMAGNAQARANFIKQAIALCDKYQFNGIDIDWEYPNFAEHNGRPEDTANFTLLLQELYQAAKAHTPALLVTIAAPAGPENYLNIEVNKIHNYLDWINVMCYDFAGPWSSITNHHAPLYQPRQGTLKMNCHDALSYYLSQGVPASKLIVGMPVYGKSFANVNSTTDGLFSTFSGAGTGTTSEAGFVFFSDIKKNLLNTYTRYWDDTAKAPYLFNKSARQFISYEDEESVTLKCHYIMQNNLGGTMVWELGLDTLSWDFMTTLFNGLQ